MDQEVDCHVCGAKCNGHKHYGGSLFCRATGGNCVITESNKTCSACRYKKCIQVGMKPKLIKGRRVKSSSQTELDEPDIECVQPTEPAANNTALLQAQFIKQLQVIREKQMLTSLSTKPEQLPMTNNSPPFYQPTSPVLNAETHFNVANKQSSLMFNRDQQVNHFNTGLMTHSIFGQMKQDQTLFSKAEPQLLSSAPSLPSQLMNSKLTSPLFSTSQQPAMIVNTQPAQMDHKKSLSRLFDKEYSGPTLGDIIPLFDKDTTNYSFKSEQSSPISVQEEAEQSYSDGNSDRSIQHSEMLGMFGSGLPGKYFNKDQNVQLLDQRANTLFAESRPFQMNAFGLAGQNFNKNVYQMSHQFPATFNQGFAQTNTPSRFPVALSSPAYQHNHWNLPGVTSNVEHRGALKLGEEQVVAQKNSALNMFVEAANLLNSSSYSHIFEFLKDGYNERVQSENGNPFNLSINSKCLSKSLTFQDNNGNEDSSVLSAPLLNSNLEICFTLEENIRAKALKNLFTSETISFGIKTGNTMSLLNVHMGNLNMAERNKQVLESSVMMCGWFFKLVTSLPDFERMRLQTRQLLAKRNSGRCINIMLSSHFFGHQASNLIDQESVTFEVGSKQVLESLGIQDYSKFPTSTYEVVFGDPTNVNKKGKRDLGRTFSKSNTLMVLAFFTAAIDLDQTTLETLNPEEKIIIKKLHQNLFMMYKRCLKHLHGPRKSAQILSIQENATNELENIAGHLR